MNRFISLDELLHHIKYRFMSKSQLTSIINDWISFDAYMKLANSDIEGATGKAKQLYQDFKDNKYPIKYNKLTIDEVNKIC